MLAHTNPPLPPYPWLVQSEPGRAIANQRGRKTRQSTRTRQIRLGIEVGLALLVGGTSLWLLWPSAQPVPAADLAPPPATTVTAAAPAPIEPIKVVDSAMVIAAPAAVPREPVPAAKLTKRVPEARVAAPLIGSSADVQQVIAMDAAPVVITPTPPVAEAAASPATIAKFRSVIDESRDAARLVIRLSNRQRPPRDASAEELTGYRLRQQNADAARGYRKYLDTLARSMRSSPSEAVSQQLLERARQTQAYIAKMLEDSQASLR